MGKEMFRSMTLSSLMQKMAANETIFIGAASGFLFIGNLECYKEKFAELEEEADKALNKQTNSVNRLISDINKEIEKENKDRDGTHIAKIQSDLLNVHKKLRERKVLDCYKKILEGDESGTAIIIRGSEMGRYWFKHEFEEDHK